MKGHLILLITTLIIAILLCNGCFEAKPNPATTIPEPVSKTTEPTSTVSEPPITTSSPDPPGYINPTSVYNQPEIELQVHFIDVGQGDAILFDLGDIEVLIDGGDRSPGVVDYLQLHVDDALELLVATHPHADHIGGLIDVLANFDVEEIWHNGDTSTSKTFKDFMAGVDSEYASVNIAARGDTICAGDLTFQVLNPFNLDGSTNNNSIVLYLKYGKIDFLFMGDAEVETEEIMLNMHDIPLPNIDILKVGHHGSSTASSVDFLDAITPEVAIYMCKIDNSYGHPHEETIQALNAIGADIYGTDVNGTIILNTDGETYNITLEKETSPANTEIQSNPETPTDNPVDLIEESKVSDVILYREYSWEYGYYEWTWQLSVPEEAYSYYQELPRPPTHDYSVYVTHPMDDPYIDKIVMKFREVGEANGFSEYEMVEFAAAFVQSLPYAYDSVTTPYDEYPRYPIETLVDNGGDCEDTSILLASIIHSMGYDVVLIVPPDHCAIGIKGGENVSGTYWEYGGSKYFYLETTGENWRIGQLPEAYKDMSAQIYPMIPTPILTHEWTVAGEGLYAILEVKVKNLGTATANNVSVYAGFDAGNNQIWNAERSNTVSIEPGYQYTTTLYIRVPLNVHTRLMIQIAMDGYAVDNSYSEWFDT